MFETIIFINRNLVHFNVHIFEMKKNCPLLKQVNQPIRVGFLFKIKLIAKVLKDNNRIQ